MFLLDLSKEGIPSLICNISRHKYIVIVFECICSSFVLGFTVLRDTIKYLFSAWAIVSVWLLLQSNFYPTADPFQKCLISKSNLSGNCRAASTSYEETLACC